MQFGANWVTCDQAFHESFKEDDEVEKSSYGEIEHVGLHDQVN